MDPSILVTKLVVPPTRAKLVPRPSLIDWLNSGLDRKLTLLSAPAGFGKTTLVSYWVKSFQDNDEIDGKTIKVAWLSIDEDDNDPARFLIYFITALNQIPGVKKDLGQGALSMLHAAQPQAPSVNSILISLINDLATIPEKLVFVLDDYHLIEAQPIDQALTFLLEHLPSQLHLVIATRQDPHLLLGRLRARDQLTEIRATDLRFTSSEAADFLNRIMGLNLSSEDIAQLETRTEGWIAGLQLAALALQGTISMQGRKDHKGFIKAFTGGHRLVLDFLIEEVLDQQPKSIQRFLLQTAILDQITGSLCDALTGQENSQGILEMLDHANLFIVPLDEERRWYRYHHLFADLLRQRLCHTQPDQLPTLQRRASKWYEQNGFTDEAIEHALRAAEFEQAARLIDEFADAIWHHTDHARFRRWLDKLPAKVIIASPHLCILHAVHLFLSGHMDEAEQRLQAAEQILELGKTYGTDTLPEPDLMILLGRAAVTRAGLASVQGDLPSTIQHARQALGFLPESESTWRGLAYDNLGNAHSFRGDVASAYQAREKALAASKAAGNIYMILFASLKLVVTLRDQGRLQQALEACQKQLELASENGLTQSEVVGWLYALWGEMLAETNELDRALKLTRKGVGLSEQGKDMHLLGSSNLCLMRVLYSRGDLADAGEVIQNLETFALEHDVSPWITNQMRAWQARLWLVQNDLDAASRWERELEVDVDGELTPVHDFDYVVVARILIAQERLDDAARLLHRLLDAAQAGGRISKMIEILVLQTLAFQAGGDTGQAMAPLEQALTLAEPGGFIRAFVDEGPPMARLLYEALSRGISPNYVRRLLAAFPVAEPVQTDTSESQAPNSGLIEPLSEREIEVLQLIAQGLTNPEIAARLILSPHTVKAHTRNIYGKLGAHNRTEAVARARAFGVLPSA